MKKNSFYIFRKSHLQTLKNIISLLAISFFISSCDFNLLGGRNSEISSNYNPGLRTESLPPTISPFADLEIDENDTVTLPFTINDPDTFLFCSGINVAVRSSNHAIISPSDMSVSGAYPDCLLTIRSRSVGASTQITITAEVYDYWSTVGSSFKLTVRRVEKPGPFRITSTEGLRKSILVHWSNADYMDGSSARYNLYYKKIADQSLIPSAFTGVAPVYTASPSASQSTFIEVRNVRSPYWITAPVHDLEDSATYEIYVTARNAFNSKNPTVPPEESNHVFVRTLDRFQFKVREFVASSKQEFKPPALHDGVCSGGGSVPLSPLAEPCVDTDRYFAQSSLGSPMERTSVLTGSSRYRTYLNAQGLMFGENP